ncbi:MAG: hypothetical protein PHV93_03220 [Candidatus Pacebacteria bacterium]|nr:hypothetical protein [Candidatus Paceibacterota bacterium]
MPLENLDTKTESGAEGETFSDTQAFVTPVTEGTFTGEKMKVRDNPNEDPEFLKFAKERRAKVESRGQKLDIPEKEKIYPDPFDDPAFKEVARIVIGEGGKHSKEQVIEQAVRGFIEKYPKKAKFYSFNPESAEVGRRLELEFTRAKLREISPTKKIEDAPTTMPMPSRPQTAWGRAKSFFGRLFR